MEWFVIIKKDDPKPLLPFLSASVLAMHAPLSWSLSGVVLEMQSEGERHRNTCSLPLLSRTGKWENSRSWLMIWIIALWSWMGTGQSNRWKTRKQKGLIKALAQQCHALTSLIQF